MDPASNITGRGFLRAGEGEDTIVSAIGNEVQAWDAADGRLVWALKGLGQLKGLEVVETQSRGKDILVLWEEEGSVGVVRRLTAATGEVLWEYRDER